jgi:hypothetical protein
MSAKGHKRTSATLFDHLVGLREQSGRDRYAERPATRARPSRSLSANGIKTLIWRTRSTCCAQVIVGRANAMPPRSAMNSRRLMGFTPAQGSLTHYNKSWRAFYAVHRSEIGCSCPFWVISGHFAVQSPCPLFTPLAGGTRTSVSSQKLTKLQATSVERLGPEV